MRLIATAAAGILLATTMAYASPATLSSPEISSPLEYIQAAQKKKEEGPAAAKADQKATPQKAAPQKAAPAAKNETMTQKVKRTWRRWTSPSHAFCVRCPIPIPVTSKTCTAKGKTVGEAQSVCRQQNPICYVNAGKC